MKYGCPNCGHSFTLEEGKKSISGPHTKLSCPLCDRYIKFIPKILTTPKTPNKKIEFKNGCWPGTNVPID